jgi:hypothetical protein
MAPPPQVAPQYGMPFMIPVPNVPAAAPAPVAVAPAGPIAEVDKCLSDAGAAADCEAALGQIAASGQPGGALRIWDVYKKGCAKKAKLLSCAVFKSTAVTEADRPAVELLMTCEAGRPEACEDVSTKSAPLQAWLTTLKTEGCKKGHSALCKSYKECKGATQFGCRPTTPPSGKDVCGCVPRSCEGTMSVLAASRTWPDGSARGVFRCEAAR